MPAANMSVEVKISDLPQFKRFADACIRLLKVGLDPCPYCSVQGGESAKHAEDCELEGLRAAAREIATPKEHR